jgi:hypothetical protein
MGFEMKLSKLLIRFTTIGLVTCLITGCDQNTDSGTDDQVIQLKVELEQLANQVGRLEFRIFQLENEHSLQEPRQDIDVDSPTTPNDTITQEKITSPDGQYDLTPVDP